jgi:BA14K-like protein
MMTNRFVKSLAVVMVLGIAAITSSQNAYAGKGTRNFVYGALAGVAGVGIINSLSRRGYYNRGYRYRRYNNNYGDRYYSRRPYYHRSGYNNYYRPRHSTYYAPRRAYRSRPVAWSPAWYRYCASKYRTFRRSDGTFQPYKGARRVCS